MPSFEELRRAGFDPREVQPLVREFYEHTAGFAMDVWSKAYFPASTGSRLDADRVGLSHQTWRGGHVFIDERGALRCDHTVRFLGLPVLRLHYKMVRVSEPAAPPSQARWL